MRLLIFPSCSRVKPLGHFMPIGFASGEEIVWDLIGFLSTRLTTKLGDNGTRCEYYGLGLPRPLKQRGYKKLQMLKVLHHQNNPHGSLLNHERVSNGTLWTTFIPQQFSCLHVVGFHAIEAPVLHPMSEGLFNFVIGWTFMFAPLLFTDHRRDRYGGSLDVLWGFQMFLTNTFLIPYMAIRLDDVDAKHALTKPYRLVSSMTKGAPIVGTIGGIVCLVSALWAVFGRADGGYGELTDRLEFLGRYLGSERLAYAFIWDIILYAIFQPWLIGANLQNVKESTLGVVRTLRFVPVVGLVAYLLCLEDDESLRSGEP